jgi:hypothetical protein
LRYRWYQTDGSAFSVTVSTVSTVSTGSCGPMPEAVCVRPRRAGRPPAPAPCPGASVAGACFRLAHRCAFLSWMASTATAARCRNTKLQRMLDIDRAWPDTSMNASNRCKDLRLRSQRAGRCSI